MMSRSPMRQLNTCDRTLHRTLGRTLDRTLDRTFDRAFDGAFDGAYVHGALLCPEAVEPPQATLTVRRRLKAVQHRRDRCVGHLAIAAMRGSYKAMAIAAMRGSYKAMIRGCNTIIRDHRFIIRDYKSIIMDCKAMTSSHQATVEGNAKLSLAGTRVLLTSTRGTTQS